MSNQARRQAGIPGGAAIAGADGFAFGPDGTLYVATGAGKSEHASSVVALEPKTLKLKDWYSAPEGFASSPVVLQYKDKAAVVAESKDGRLHLLDASSLGGTDHRTPLVAPAAPNAGDLASVASWQDALGTAWIVAPASGAVAALKIVDRNGAPVIEPGWSHEMASATPASIINGVVFAASQGPAPVLYVLDAATGAELWNSGKTITSRVNGGVSGGGGQVYVTAGDTLYAFGFPMEH